MEPHSLAHRHVQRTLAVLQGVLKEYQPRDFSVRLWDGTVWEPNQGEPARFSLILRHPGALRRMLWPLNQLTLGEAYIYDDFDIEGDIEEAFRLADYLLNINLSLAEKWSLGRHLLGLPSKERLRSTHLGARLRGAAHSLERDAQAVTHHYNTSNEFYKLWLDERMIYSCAYFTEPDEDLEKAQERKLDYICRKLRLKEGEHLLDIGCGWGALTLYAAKYYGAKALGITLSEPQAELANECICQAGLADRCRVEVRDYREIDAPGTYDKLVSVGMFEHVGGPRLREYFDRAWRLLRPGGVFLNHGIASSLSRPLPDGPSFIDRYVFPDGELVPIAETLHTAEASGFDVRDLENLREHYALTLHHWVKRLETNHAAARRCTNEGTYRVWRLYMAGSAHGFSVGRLNLYQALLAKPDKGCSGLPLTRADWYC
jgi:cyclopropane-fatty-acyl-phospholipid synthase